MKCKHCGKPQTISVREALEGADAHGALSTVLAHYTSNLWGWLRKEDEWRGLSFTNKGEFSITCVAKSTGPDGTPTVLFASGTDVVSALLGASGAVGRGDWRPDQWAIKQKNGEKGS